MGRKQVHSFGASVICLMATIAPRTDLSTDEALALSKSRFLPSRDGDHGAQLKRQEKRFLELLEEIAKSDPETSANAAEATIAQKLKLIARDRKTRPQMYSEIRRIYVEGPTTINIQEMPRALISPPLEKKYVTPEHRLAWEFVLLAPIAREMECFEQRAIEALAQIGNPACLPTLQHFFESTCADGVHPESVTSPQSWIALGLCSFPSERSLNILLHCLELSENQRERIAKKTDTTPLLSICNSLALWEKAGMNEAVVWKNLLSQAAGTLPNERQRQICAQLVSALK